MSGHSSRDTSFGYILFDASRGLYHLVFRAVACLYEAFAEDKCEVIYMFRQLVATQLPEVAFTF